MGSVGDLEVPWTYSSHHYDRADHACAQLAHLVRLDIASRHRALAMRS